jgi:predicted dehydrogenase/threonine dehydrogenase-like Zn-dependent dehydrogenase
MKQAIQHLGSGELEVADVPPPLLRPPGVLVANECSLISVGTERSTVDTARKSLLGKALARPEQARKVLEKVMSEGLTSTLNLVRNRLEAPAELGYSSAGTILSVGEEALDRTPGQRVACAGQGFASHAEVVYVPHTLTVPIPDGVSSEDASYVALGSIALQSVRRADVRVGESVVVVGLGVLGQLTVQLLRAAGCHVVGTDLDAGQFMGPGPLAAHLEVPLAEVETAVDNATGGLGADAVILAASTRENGPIELAGRIARKRGVVVVLGAVGMDVPRETFYRKELDLRLSTSYGPGRYDPNYEERGRDYPPAYVRWTEQRNMGAFLRLVAEGRVKPSLLTTHRFTIDEAPRAYDLIVEGGEPHRGIVFTYPGGPHTEASEAIRSAPTAPRDASVLRVGIIGPGSHFQDRLLPHLQKQAGLAITAVCSSRGPAARGVADKVGAPIASTRAADLTAADDVDVVVIATRHGTHAELALAAMRAGKKVFLEKPMCTTESELDEMRDFLSRTPESLLMLGFNRRFSPHIAAILDDLGPRTEPLVMTYRVNAGVVPPDHWIQDLDEGGGRIVGEACHFIDTLAAVAQAEPVRTSASSVAHHPSGIVSDRSVMTFDFSDGSVGSLVYTASGGRALPKERLEIFASGRSYVVDDFRTTTRHDDDGSRRIARGFDKGFAREIEAFVEACRQGGTSPTPPATVLAVTRATFDAMRALRGREPTSA